MPTPQEPPPVIAFNSVFYFHIPFICPTDV
jgi:hypothetical protein